MFYYIFYHWRVDFVKMTNSTRFFLMFAYYIAIKHFFSHMQDFLKKKVFFNKKVYFLYFFVEKFGHIKIFLYLCTRKRKTSLTQ